MSDEKSNEKVVRKGRVAAGTVTGTAAVVPPGDAAGTATGEAARRRVRAATTRGHGARAKARGGVPELPRGALIGCTINRNFREEGEAFITIARANPSGGLDVAYFTVDLDKRRIVDCDGSLRMSDEAYLQAIARAYGPDEARESLSEPSACAIVKAAMHGMEASREELPREFAKFFSLFSPAARATPADAAPFAEDARAERKRATTAQRAETNSQDVLVLREDFEAPSVDPSHVYLALEICENFFFHELDDEVKREAVDRFDPSGEIGLPDFEEGEIEIGENDDPMRDFLLDWVCADFALSQGLTVAEVVREVLGHILPGDLNAALVAVRMSHYDFYRVTKRNGAQHIDLKSEKSGQKVTVYAPTLDMSLHTGDTVLARVIPIAPTPVLSAVVALPDGAAEWLMGYLDESYGAFREREPLLSWREFMKRRGHTVFTPLAQIVQGIEGREPYGLEDYLTREDAAPSLATARAEDPAAFRSKVNRLQEFIRSEGDEPRDVWFVELHPSDEDREHPDGALMLDVDGVLKLFFVEATMPESVSRLLAKHGVQATPFEAAQLELSLLGTFTRGD